MSEVVNKYMPLETGELVLQEMEGNAYNFGSHVIARLLGVIDRVLSVLTGTTKKVHLVVTDRRIIVVEIRKVLWFIDGSVLSRSITARSVRSSGYRLARSFLIFKSHYLDFDNGSLQYAIKSRSGQQEVITMIQRITTLADPITNKVPA
jgi:hypothetical protein